VALHQVMVVGDHDDGALLGPPAQHHLDQVGRGAGIDGVEGFVQQDDAGILQEEAGEQNALKLPDRQPVDRAAGKPSRPTADRAAAASSRWRPEIAAQAPTRRQWPSWTSSPTEMGKLRSIAAAWGR
jgi:hypothetical protein